MRRLLWFIVAIGLISLLLFFTYLFYKNEENKVNVHTVATVQLSDVDNDTVAGFKERMSELGYQEGEKIRYISSAKPNSSHTLERSILDLLAEKPDLILVSSTNATLEVKRLTQKNPVPVVFAPVNNPLSSGVVSDMKHPGGHITGVRLPTGDDLRLQWLKKIVPSVKKVYFPYYADDVSGKLTLKEISPVAAHLDIELVPNPVSSNKELADAITTNKSFDAIFIPRDSRIEARIDDFVALAKSRKIPVCAPSLQQVKRGALMSYGFVHHDIGRQAAQMADQIFRGTTPGNLPIEMAENSLAINLESAKSIGIVVSPEILQQTEQIIDSKTFERMMH